TTAGRLPENLGIAFMGDTKGGPFDIPEPVALGMLRSPNPNGKPSSDVLVPWSNGLDVTRRPRWVWILDFPLGMDQGEAALYESVFGYVEKHVKPLRET